jgi:hypothetical protein
MTEASPKATGFGPLRRTAGAGTSKRRAAPSVAGTGFGSRRAAAGAQGGAEATTEASARDLAFGRSASAGERQGAGQGDLQGLDLGKPPPAPQRAASGRRGATPGAPASGEAGASHRTVALAPDGRQGRVRGDDRGIG